MELIVTILLVVDLFLWFLTLLPATAPALGSYGGWLAFVAVLLLTILLVSGRTLGLR